MSDQPDNKLRIKDVAVSFYVLIAIGYTVWAWLWGPHSYRGFFYNFGQGLVWPFVMFPTLGKIVGGILIVAIVVAATASSNRKPG